MDEKRHDLRHRALREAKVVLSDWGVIDCLIRDQTEIGARLVFNAPTELPKEFRLLIVSPNLLIPAELRWQRGLSAGVHFTGPAMNAPPRKW